MSAPRIAVLPGAVADQIAAGEVIERPASVVKELVENALDAGATAIHVDVMEGGRALIRVSDDGSGMDAVNAPVAIARHATSKIRAAADLVGVASYGFRGEALPAIASVSRLAIETAPAHGAGTRVVVHAGAPAVVTEAARRQGTTVTVESLFANAPARQRFLKGARAEWRAIIDALTIVALIRRDVRLTVTHDGKEQLALPTASGLRERVGALWGHTVAERLVAVDDVAGPIRVAGLVERPADVGTASRRVFLSVNGRAIRDAGIVRAAEAAYRSAIPSGVRPSLLLDITLPVADVDVNVHPAKTEVRFADRWTLERAVERAVRRALGTEDAEASLGARSWWQAPAATPAPLGREVEPSALIETPAPTPLFAQSDDAPTPVDGEPEIVVPPLVQLRRTFLMFERDDAVVLIDQHSAHERVLYERFLGEFERGDAASQALLFPLTLHLSPAEAEAFEQAAAFIRGVGYQVESFGGSALLVHAVPTPHPRFDAERCLRETLAALTGDRAAASHGKHERLIATMACKAAIKAGEALRVDEMNALFVALARTTLPAHDVHGRATVVQLGWDEIERRFGRR
ncbi:MAG: DNA mismatch repair endonuclease MutL [Gemmatimonadaceae bacterium]|nr:DNA mismatch repair endonuclease MutL [Gemmatimonadaceae bacterium]